MNLPYFRAMKNTSKGFKQVNYQWLGITTLALMLLLILLQVNWLRNAIHLQNQELEQKLRRLVGDVALEVRKASPVINDISIKVVQAHIDSMLKANDIDQTIHFAIYEDTIQGSFNSSYLSSKKELRQSPIKSCLSCIMSFAVADFKSKRRPNESEAAYAWRLTKDATFQYFSQVKQGQKLNTKNTWLTLYQPNKISQAIRSQIYLFVLNVLLLLLLLYMFFYLLRALSKHKKLAQVKEDFFNNMTHEFKMPLSSIRLASTVIRQSPDEQKKVTYHQLIEQESQRLEQQIDKLLDLSLLDNQQISFDLQPVNLTQLLTELPQRLNALIEKKKARLHLDLQFDESEIQADAHHLSNSFYNLIENSLKYSSDGVHIWIIGQIKGAKKVLHFRDNGPGIGVEFQKYIFDRFYRGQKNNQYKGQGFGIGLSYVKSVIEAHGGYIYLNTAYTEGCEFVIKL